MKRVASVLAIAATVSMGAMSVSNAASSDEPTYDEFKTQTYQDADRQYIVNGDIPLEGKKQLREFYQELVNPQYESQLIVNTVYGKDDIWSASQAQDLTYCVSTDFGSDHAAIVDAMEAGGNQWESASSAVDFTYDSSQDANCSTSNDNVLFSVEPVQGASYIARAFFPSTSKSARNVLVNTDQIFSSGSWTADNVLAHELQGQVRGSELDAGQAQLDAQREELEAGRAQLEQARRENPQLRVLAITGSAGSIESMPSAVSAISAASSSGAV